MIKLQSKNGQLRNTTVNINGKVFPIDGTGVCEVDDASAKKLLSFGDAWSTSISALARGQVSRFPQAGQPMRGAAEFCELMMQDKEVEAKVSSFRSFRALYAFADGLGFRFSELEFAKAAEMAAKDLASLVPQEAQPTIPETQPAPVKEQPKAKKKEVKAKEEPKEEPKKEAKRKTSPKMEKLDFSLIEENENLPEILDEEKTGEWPEPVEEMGLAYLRRMADAYEVVYSPQDGKARLVEAISDSMFE